MVLTHIDLKYVSLIFREIRKKVPNGKELRRRHRNTLLDFIDFSAL